MIEERTEILRRLPFFDGTQPDAIRRLASMAVERDYQPGDTIIQEGSTGGDVYLILEGVVEVIKGEGSGEMGLAQRGAGEFFGEMGFIEGRPRFATIRALEPTRLLEISEGAMRSLLATEPEVLYRTVEILSARLRESDLQMIADLHRKNQELARAYRDLQEAQAALVEKERLERELELARELQRSILPNEFPSTQGFACAARYRPARQVGGDFYDVFSVKHGKVGLVMADVADKGMPAALFMALTRSLIRAEAGRSESPRDVLLRVNNLLLEMSRAERFVTVFFGILDPGQGTLVYARAGHDRPIWCSPETGQLAFLEGSGMLLGMVEPVTLEEVHLELAAGDSLILYTDGITDAQSSSGESFGVDRLHQAVLTTSNRSAQEMCNGIFSAVEHFQQGLAQFDDIALLVARLSPRH
jgi:serine phosphatase RsbU (regulator of sigma subunit)